jgi:hypothetical protein
MTKSKQNSSANEEKSPLKYPDPAILLMDIEESVAEALEAKGYNIATGSFGKPYKVNKSSDYSPLISNGSFPDNYTETEIIVVDLVPNEILPEAVGKKRTPMDEADLWVNCRNGKIDPRPSLMSLLRDGFDRIYKYGGIFIVFVESRKEQDIQLAEFDRHLGVIPLQEIPINNWSFLSQLSGINSTYSAGKKIVVEGGYSISSLLSKHIQGCEFNCVLSVSSYTESRWLPLAHNKFGGCVSGRLWPKPETDEGLIFLFPPIKDKAVFLTQMFEEVLPKASRKLFPHAEDGKWVHEPEYELLSVQKLQSHIDQVKEETEKQIEQLQQQIKDEHEQFKYLYDLIRETGDSLVDAVKKALDVLGFKDVIDADKELEKSNGDRVRREDLRINDSPLLLIEIKGIVGTAKDNDALQVTNYLASYMEEMERFDISCLSIINHERNKPALDRNDPFRKEQIKSAENRKSGLMTTWDLFRLVRGYLKNNWSHEDVKELFYQNGIIEPIPLHYEYIGVIEHFWEKAGAVSIRIDGNSISVDDVIAFELSVEFEEQAVKSLQIDSEPVEVAKKGDLVGISTEFTKEQMKPKTKVYRCRSV